MDTNCSYITYQSVGSFSNTVIDYLNQKETIKSFYKHAVSIDGVKAAIEERKKFKTDRKKIQDILNTQYASSNTNDYQRNNISLLSNENTFTICTAHQPNIFTGYLYFIYKTAHIIAICKELKHKLPEYNFIPVFYIGSEDNDLEELSRFHLNGKVFKWETNQTGAVGRMLCDKKIEELITSIESELGHLPKCNELISLLKKSYSPGLTMSDSVFTLLNELFKEEGLLVLQPDNIELKNSFKAVMKDDLINNTAEKVVSHTLLELNKTYKAQVNPRNVNLFYLRDGIRNRIDKRGDQYSVDGTVIKFNQSQIISELEEDPSRFSPNVTLRGLYQETILPNIIFVGGGSEIAYWLQLKDLFNTYNVPYPLLVLRNSFLLMDNHQIHKMSELNIQFDDLFKEETILANQMVQKWGEKEISLKEEEKESKKLFSKLKNKASETDKSLAQHVHALETFHLKKLEILEKKMLKAERKKHAIQLQRIWKLKEELFPKNNLQERVENFMPYLAKYGKEFINVILENSKAFDQEFGILTITKSAS